MSLLSKTTSAQLGIGQGDAGDFATGVKKKKKDVRKQTVAQQAAQQSANELGDARLQDQQDVNVDYDPKADNAANLMLNTNDKAFIESVQQLQSDLFSGRNSGGGGARSDAAGFLALADQSSRGGLGDMWNDAIGAIFTKGGLGPRKLALAQEAFTQAYEATGAVLNLDVNTATYNFDPASTTAGPVGAGFKTQEGGSGKAQRVAQKATGVRARANEGVSANAVGTFAWDLAADQAQDDLAIKR